MSTVSLPITTTTSNMTAITYTQAERAVVKSLTVRAKNLCSSEAVEQEKTKVQAILKSNDNKQLFIKRSLLNRPPSIENNEV